MKKVILLILILVFAMAGCNNEEAVLTETADQNGITPYQFLNLSLGNADDFYFDYTISNHDANRRETGYFQKSGEKCAAVYTARDMNGNSVTVRELEMEGRVFYILDDVKIIKSYLFPAEDFLIYELMDAAATKPQRVYQKDGYHVYEHERLFIQDESIVLNYRFFMQDGTLKKAEYSVDGRVSATYEFSEFRQEIKNEKIFDYPAGYSEEWFYYQYSGENMPPWWEIGNDS